MVKSDKTNLELQVAAVALCEEFENRSQGEVARELARVYPTEGRFDNSRVSRLCRYAIAAKLATEPTKVKLVRGTGTDSWYQAFCIARSALSLEGPLARSLGNYCSRFGLPPLSDVAVVSGIAHKPNDKPTSEFATNVARVALKYLRDWLAAHPHERLRIGVSWGRQMHQLAVAVNLMLISGHLDRARLSVVPIVGLPIGGHVGDTMSSSEIAKSLAAQDADHAADFAYDLRLVPAYLPESEFSDRDLPALYKLLGLVDGWARIFGPDHMTRAPENPSTGSAAEVLGCNFILSSVSDLSQPFGFVRSRRRPALVPFASRARPDGAPVQHPAADCGGVPLWANPRPEAIAAAEASFNRRWTGIRRNQWLHCANEGRRARAKDNVVSGAVLFAPTAEKAQPLLYAVRDGLANALILGAPCAEKMTEILAQEGCAG